MVDHFGDRLVEQIRKIKSFLCLGIDPHLDLIPGIFNENGKIKPISFYGKTKFLAEKFIVKKLEGKINYFIGRIFNTTNKNQKKN